MRAQTRQNHSGVALVLVLWVITLLSVIAGNFAYSMRSEAQIASNLLHVAQAQAQADAGFHRALFELLKPPTDLQRWQANGVEHLFVLDGFELRVSILDESGKIDLNVAPAALLKGLFKSAGLSEEASTELLEKVRPTNATNASNAANITPPKPFESVDDLQKIEGMNAALFQKLAPALTVYSGLGIINAQVAAREVLLAIPDVNPALVEQYVLDRQKALLDGQSVPPFPGGAGFVGMVPPGMSAFSVRSEAHVGGRIGFVRLAVARLSRNMHQPPQVLAWGAGDTEN
ncbi:MAG: general secretion pathway protein GspK [Rhodoferax sp.]|nr:general secretion pathway protein GspK [Rhodoferax sp.]